LSVVLAKGRKLIYKRINSPPFFKEEIKRWFQKICEINFWDR